MKRIGSAVVGREQATGKWQTRAACRGTNAEIFFPEGPRALVEAHTATAKNACGRCPVRETCLEAALAAEEGTRVEARHGIYGGLTALERHALTIPADSPDDGLTHATRGGYTRGCRCTPCRDANTRYEQQRSARETKPGTRLAPCGTRSAYRRHRRRGEPVDDACRVANTAADRRLRTTGTTVPRAQEVAA